MKNKVVAGLLAIFLGSLGIHKFYLGKYPAGILYLIFSWTGIPGLIGFVEGIVYLLQSESTWHAKYNSQFLYQYYQQTKQRPNNIIESFELQAHYTINLDEPISKKPFTLDEMASH